MNNLTIINHEGQRVIDSREVAEATGKLHKDLLGSIRGYIQYLDGGNFRSQDFFIESTYINSQNKEQPCYLLTKKGCGMVANKMTGEKGVLFTAAYVTKFEEMENNQTVKLLSPTEMMKLQLQVLEEQEKKISLVDKKVDNLENNLPLFSGECKDLQSVVKKIATKTLGGYRSAAYIDNSIRGKVYTDIQQQLRREFGVDRYEHIKRCQLEVAKQIVKEYKAPLVLMEQIELVNSQVAI